MNFVRRIETLRWFRQGQKKARQGDLTGAVSRFRQVLQARPGHPFARVHLALALVAAGEVEEARRLASEAAARATGRPGVRLLAGRVFYDAGDLDRAREMFQSVLRDNPANDLAAGYDLLAQWAAGDREAWRQLTPNALPDSTPFLARWLEMVELELRREKWDAQRQAACAGAAPAPEGGRAQENAS
ncbi:MAG TPA: tetratricopeptide repeat protein [Candidatus Brocadiia bacterium]|nr:tetratricopeptide repeat protein [Candidatus Brocadiia bacterium]